MVVETLLWPALVGLTLGFFASILHAPHLAAVAWAVTTLAVLLPTAFEAGARLRRGEPGVDLVAVLAMAGALLFGEVLAGAILAVMVTGGSALEAWAGARARRALTALLARAPRVAHVHEGDVLRDVPIDVVAVGDRLLVRSGEVVPVDGALATESAVLDASALTGEARPVELLAGDRVASGTTNAGPPFELRATATAAASTYAGIVRLVHAALAHRAPMVRLADRYAGGFVLFTLALATIAGIAAHDPRRALAVLVVATPCPLLIATPAALVAGLSRAARAGVLVKGGSALETLARARVVLLDKTGTLTTGRPRVVSVDSFGKVAADDLLRSAAAIEQLSAHPIAPAVIQAALARHVSPPFPTGVREELGGGVSGHVDGHVVSVGRLGWLTPTPSPRAQVAQRRAAVEGGTAAFVAIDGVVEGALLVQDTLRAEAPRSVLALRRMGVGRIAMVTGDHRDIAELVGDAVGVDEVYAERTPEGKVQALRLLEVDGPVVMVGDGVNDAPVLALADVGVAMGARGATAASEAAEVVLTADRLEGLVAALRIARRTRRIALQSIWMGMGLAGVAMGFAAVGLLPPVAGALVQEVIDVAAILNALRALGGRVAPRVPPAQQRIAREFLGEHGTLRPRVDALAGLAARIDTLAPEDARRELTSARDFLVAELLPHEQEEQRDGYPALARLDAGLDPTGPLARTHQVIVRLVRLFGRLVDALPAVPGAEELREAQRTLVGLHAVLTLHFDQEDELFGALANP